MANLECLNQSECVALLLKIVYAINSSASFLIWFLKRMGHSGPLFLYFRLFYKQLTVNKCSIKVADDWIRTRVLWYRKRPLCQLCHNHCPLIWFLIWPWMELRESVRSHTASSLGPWVWHDRDSLLDVSLARLQLLQCFDQVRWRDKNNVSQHRNAPTYSDVELILAALNPRNSNSCWKMKFFDVFLNWRRTGASATGAMLSNHLQEMWKCDCGCERVR